LSWQPIWKGKIGEIARPTFIRIRRAGIPIGLEYRNADGRITSAMTWPGLHHIEMW